MDLLLLDRVVALYKNVKRLPLQKRDRVVAYLKTIGIEPLGEEHGTLWYATRFPWNPEIDKDKVLDGVARDLEGTLLAADRPNTMLVPPSHPFYAKLAGARQIRGTGTKVARVVDLATLVTYLLYRNQFKAKSDQAAKQHILVAKMEVARVTGITPMLNNTGTRRPSRRKPRTVVAEPAPVTTLFEAEDDPLALYAGAEPEPTEPPRPAPVARRKITHLDWEDIASKKREMEDRIRANYADASPEERAYAEKVIQTVGASFVRDRLRSFEV